MLQPFQGLLNSGAFQVREYLLLSHFVFNSDTHTHTPTLTLLPFLMVGIILHRVECGGKVISTLAAVFAQ